MKQLNVAWSMMIALFAFAAILPGGIKATAAGAVQEAIAEEAPPKGWTLVDSIPLPGHTTRFDYQSFDPVSKRLYIAHLGDSHLVVFNTKTNRVIADLPGFPHVHGVLYVPKLNRVYATVSSLSKRKNGQLMVVDAKSLRVVGRFETGIHPDGLDFEPKTGRLFISNEWGKDVSVFDTTNNKMLERIPLHGEVGNTRIDSMEHRIYATVQTRNLLVRIDPFSLQVDRKYRLPCQHPHGLWVNSSDRVAYVACEKDARLLVVALSSGQTLARYPTGKKPDVLSFDPVRKMLYVAAESGEVSVYKQSGTLLTPLATDFLWKNAHTIFIDPRTHRLYLPLQSIGNGPGIKVFLYDYKS